MSVKQVVKNWYLRDKIGSETRIKHVRCTHKANVEGGDQANARARMKEWDQRCYREMRRQKKQKKN